jgi:hypothetical protein
MALEQLDRAAAQGVRFSWVTADEWYSQKPAFVTGLELRGRRFVLEVPKDFAVWLYDPQSAKTHSAAKPVQTLLRYSRPFGSGGRQTEEGELLAEMPICQGFWHIGDHAHRIPNCLKFSKESESLSTVLCQNLCQLSELISLTTGTLRKL